MQGFLVAVIGCFGAVAHADDAAFDKLADQYYGELAKAHPVDATDLGIHDHDGELPDWSKAGLQRQAARLRGWQAQFAKLDAATLSPGKRIDLEMLKAGIESELLDHDLIKRLSRHPDSYSRMASNAVYVIIKRPYAPADVRMRAALSRMEKLPALLGEARKNLDGVSKVAVEIALEEISEIGDFYKRDVPMAFAEVKDAQLNARFKDANEKLQKAIVGYGEWLNKDLLPRANAPVALGEASFKKLLLAKERIGTPLDELLVRAEAEVKRLQTEFKATAARIDPKRAATDVQGDLQKDHPAPEKVIPETQASLSGLRKFLVDKNLLTLPSESVPTVQQTPPFLRATTLASMDTPGPFERNVKEAFYNVTLPEKSWSVAQTEDYLRGAFARTLIDIVSIHEAFPGHYVQFIWVPLIQSKVRKFEDAHANSEGWAHYCEQMILDEGWGKGDPKLRLSQLQDALLRAARFVVGIRMHARGMSFEQAADYFHKEGLQTKKVAQMEARRGTEDPLYIVYTLGKLEILKMRDEYKQKLGPQYSLKKFHDAILAEGPIALPLLRRALLEK